MLRLWKFKTKYVPFRGQIERRLNTSRPASSISHWKHIGQDVFALWAVYKTALFYLAKFASPSKSQLGSGVLHCVWCGLDFAHLFNSFKLKSIQFHKFTADNVPKQPASLVTNEFSERRLHQDKISPEEKDKNKLQLMQLIKFPTTP